MRGIDDYSDDELLRLLSKTVGTVGGQDRVEMIQSALDARGVQDARTTFLQGLQPTIPNDAVDGPDNAAQIMEDDR
jgi:hypothetical protein